MINWRKIQKLVSVVCTLALLSGTVMLTACNPKSGISSSESASAPDESKLTAVRPGLVVDTETAGFGELSKMELYVNGVRSIKDTMLKPQDNKKLYYSGDKIRLINYTDGYSLDMPSTWKPDFSMSSLKCQYSDANTEMEISLEKPIYEDMETYLEECSNKFILNEDYLKNNKVTLLEEVKTIEIDKFKVQVIKLKIEDMPEKGLAYYTYATLYNTSNRIYRLMFKSNTSEDFITSVVKTFVGKIPQGASVDTKTYPLTPNENWDTATKAYFSYLQNSKKVDWGLFTSKIESTGIKLTIPRMEEQIDYKFPIISQYVHIGSGSTLGIDFPRVFADKLNDQGKVLQLSYQFTTNNNMDMTAYTPTLDIYRGKMDDVLRKFAQQVKDYGKPVLFRLNNEMNTDWTSYCGLTNMNDPDIYVANWVRMYNIFKEVGVTNTIWIFNANDGTFPGTKWNNWRCFFPPVENVQMLGITGYNAAVDSNAGGWREFEEIYTEIENDNKPYFSEWPWIISEFGCSGAAADKALWIKNMFDCFEQGKFSNIKAAVWFSAADYDPETNKVTKAFWLDETAETTAAFRDGLNRTQPATNESAVSK